MIDKAGQHSLLQVARQSIEYGVDHGHALAVKPDDFDEALRPPRASFVTLHKHGQLRGCIGSLQAHRPLVEDVAQNAFAAAFRDPRFSPVRADELPDLHIEISVLSPPQVLDVEDEADLLAQLRPGVDGLILQAGAHRATYLPSVWAQLPEPKAFVRELKRKAGLPADAWPPDMRVEHYTTQSFEESWQ